MSNWCVSEVFLAKAELHLMNRMIQFTKEKASRNLEIYKQRCGSLKLSSNTFLFNLVTRLYSAEASCSAETPKWKWFWKELQHSKRILWFFINPLTWTMNRRLHAFFVSCAWYKETIIDGTEGFVLDKIRSFRLRRNTMQYVRPLRFHHTRKEQPLKHKHSLCEKTNIQRNTTTMD